jgi:hypothetical protein
LSALPLPFYDNPILFGRSGSRGLIAFESAGDAVRVWSRAEAGLTVTPEPFRPFLLLSDPDLLKGFTGDVQVIPLDGEGVYRWLAECPDWNRALKVRDHCQEASGRGPGAPDAPYRFFADAVHQFLLRSGKTSFLGMSFGDLRRLALDIEVTTAPGFEFPNAARESDCIVAIALADSTGFTRVLSGADMSEAELLAECSRLIRERDPDTIEGHNIFRFDLEYIEARARRHKVALAWGRGGAPLRGHPSRMQVADRSIAYRRYAVTGRHIIDTWILAQLYDVAARDLPSYGLKDVARHFGVAAPERTYLPPEDIPRIFLEEPARLMAYARDDVIETLSLSAILSPPYFVQAQALPFDYQMAVLRGNATKIDALLLREYLHQRRAVPAPQAGRGVAGGYTASWGGVNYARPNVGNATIKDVWKRIAEDYMPFNINVTTDSKVFQAAPAASRQRCCFTTTPITAAGVAYFGSWNWGNDTVCWSVYYVGKPAGEVGAHEPGHTLGLAHQGQEIPNGTNAPTHNEYYAGQGSGETGWAPIMGVGYYQPLATWAKGEYQYANQPQDELQTITTASAPPRSNPRAICANAGPGDGPSCFSARLRSGRRGLLSIMRCRWSWSRLEPPGWMSEVTPASSAS